MVVAVAPTRVLPVRQTGAAIHTMPVQAMAAAGALIITTIVRAETAGRVTRRQPQRHRTTAIPVATIMLVRVKAAGAATRLLPVVAVVAAVVISHPNNNNIVNHLTKARAGAAINKLNPATASQTIAPQAGAIAHLATVAEVVVLPLVGGVVTQVVADAVHDSFF